MSDGERAQREVKARLLMEASKMLGVDALGVGDGDLAFGVPFLRDGAAKFGLPYVSANVSADGTLLFPATRIVERAGKRIGITSVMLDNLGITGVAVAPPEPALRDAVTQLRGERVDLVLVLSHLGWDEDQRIASAVPGIDLIVGAHSRRQAVDPAVVGDTAIVQAGSRGKQIGELRIDFRLGKGWADPAGRERLLRQKQMLETQVARYEKEMAAGTDEDRTRLARVVEFQKKRLGEIVLPPGDDGSRSLAAGRSIAMDTSLADQPAMRKLVDTYLEQLGPEGQDPIAAALTERASKPDARGHGDYMGVEACRACHSPIVDDWLKTGHARAWPMLVKSKRQNDLECWSCHVTAANQPGGPSSPAEVGSMRNVQCEACHGPARAHVAHPASGNVVRNPSVETCLACHDEKQDMGRFDYATYLPKIDHKP